MLLAAGFICLFLGPPGFRPGWARMHPPSRVGVFLLQWEWFRIYFESGVAKILSGDPEWRDLTAMDQYYQNGPLPIWIGWYLQHLLQHLTWVFYDTTAQLIWMFARVPLPVSPVTALEPFRIANQYGLFAVMTRGRYEIEFQGSDDGQNWVVYPFRYKPQALDQPPGIYALYQPRFDWNLWFASLGSWRQYPIVPNTEVRLLAGDQDVLALFASDPFAGEPPRQVRAVLWQYWFTTLAEKQANGLWWHRRLLGLYAPTLEREPDGIVRVLEWPTLEPHE